MKPPADGLVVTPTTERFKKLKWDAKTRVYYYHNVTLKDDAQVWLKGIATVKGKNVDVPLLVARPYGKGWVVAFLGTALGDPQHDQMPLWKWEDWARMLTIALNASRSISDNQGNEKPT